VCLEEDPEGPASALPDPATPARSTGAGVLPPSIRIRVWLIVIMLARIWAIS
jgi:hypothetical protein